MASFRLNVARISGLPAVGKLLSALKAFGTAPDDRFGLLSYQAAGESVAATIAYRYRQSIRQLDPSGRDLISTAVERAIAYPLLLTPARDRLELYQGAANGIQRIEMFLRAQLSLDVVAKAIEMDVARAVDQLNVRVERFQLRCVRLEGYAADSYVTGTYCARFSDSEHGLEFVADNQDNVLTATVSFAASHGRATVVLARNACFTYSCDEEDKPSVQSSLRRLVH